MFVYLIANHSTLDTEPTFKGLPVAASLIIKTIFVASTDLTFTILVVDAGKFANAIIGVQPNP
jgi:hypothetical protein